jgi:hypothetical protein
VSAMCQYTQWNMFEWIPLLQKIVADMVAAIIDVSTVYPAHCPKVRRVDNQLAAQHFPSSCDNLCAGEIVKPGQFLKVHGGVWDTGEAVYPGGLASFITGSQVTS